MRRSALPFLLFVLALLTACGDGADRDIPTAPPTPTPTPTTPTTPTTPPPPPPTSAVLCPSGGELGLAVGEQVILRNQSSYCFNFAASSSVTEYLVGVQSVGEAGVAVRTINVSGQRVTTTAQQASGASGPAQAPEPAEATRLSPPFLANPEFQLLREHRAAHHARLDRWVEPLRDALLRKRVRVGVQRDAQRSPGPQSVVVTGEEEVGDQVEFRVRRGNSRNCEETASVDILGELRVKNERSMWFVDVENPAGGFTDEQLQEMADLFDDHIYDTETAYLGVENDKDGNGRVGILITQQINKDNGDEGPQTIGFVNPCDLVTRGELDGRIHTSNEGEFFYAIAPDPDGLAGRERDTDRLFDFLPLVIAHEFAHIIQFSHRFTQTGDLMALYMAEGQATLAEEIVGHSVLGYETGQNLPVSVAFDFEDLQPFPWYLNPWFDLVHYFGWPGGEEVTEDTPRVEGAPEECTWTEEGDDHPCGGRPLVYGVTWSFLRWAADQFGEELGGEPIFHQSLITNNTSGFDNLREILGRFGLLEDMLAQWAAAFYMDDRPGRSDPRHALASWNYFSAFDGLKTQAWLEPKGQGYADFTEEVKVRDPSIAYLLVGGSIAPQFSLKVEGAGGGTLGSDIQVWLVRTQ